MIMIITANITKASTSGQNKLKSTQIFGIYWVTEFWLLLASDV